MINKLEFFIPFVREQRCGWVAAECLVTKLTLSADSKHLEEIINMMLMQHWSCLQILVPDG